MRTSGNLYYLVCSTSFGFRNRTVLSKLVSTLELEEKYIEHNTTLDTFSMLVQVDQHGSTIFIWGYTIVGSLVIVS